MVSGRPCGTDGPTSNSCHAEDLIEFITEGSVAQAAYGVNGIGSGRMPAFGQILTSRRPGR